MLNRTSKLADWDDDDPSVITETTTKWDKVVILKNMFTLQELEVCDEHLREIKPLTLVRMTQQQY